MALQREKPKKKLPYLTDEELNAPISAVKIRVTGEYFKRGEHRNDVYEESYEAEIVVPTKYNIGQVKLQASRYVKKELKGVRVRTFFIDSDFKPEPVTDKKYVVKDFMSDMGLDDNARQKKLYLERIAKKRAAEEEGDDIQRGISVVSKVVEDHDYSVPE